MMRNNMTNDLKRGFKCIRSRSPSLMLVALYFWTCSLFFIPWKLCFTHKSRKGLNSTHMQQLMFIPEREIVSASILTKMCTSSYCLIDINPEHTNISSFRQYRCGTVLVNNVCE